MHYPWCGGANQGDLVLTQRDREGVAAIYGARPTTCSQRTPLYQTHNPYVTDYFYTISPSERDISIMYSGYTYHGIAAALESVQVAGTLPFQRFYKGPPQREHFYTSSSAEVSYVLANGWVYESVEGYIYTSQQPGTMPFYRLNRWEPSTADLQHFYTINAGERDYLIQQGWGYDGIAGYVCPW